MKTYKYSLGSTLCGMCLLPLLTACGGTETGGTPEQKAVISAEVRPLNRLCRKGCTLQIRKCDRCPTDGSMSMVQKMNRVRPGARPGIMSFLRPIS